MTVGISKADLDDLVEAVTPSEIRGPLVAVLDEIKILRTGHNSDPLVAAELVTLEDSVLRVLRLVNHRPAQPRRSLLLSRRELHVVEHLTAGQSNKQIARGLAISERTVRNHLTRVFSKLGATNRTEAAVIAMREGLVIR